LLESCQFGTQGAPGSVKTKERLGIEVWWPAMDCDAERRCAECYGCQMVTKNVPPPPLKFNTITQPAMKELWI